MPPIARLRTLALYLVVVGVWGTTWIAIKASVASIPPLTASGLRFAIAFPLVITYVFVAGLEVNFLPGIAGHVFR